MRVEAPPAGPRPEILSDTFSAHTGKRVIFNADDFGASARTNRAALRAHLEGVLTSASLMVSEPGFHEAVSMARDAPDLSVGLHLTLSNGFAAQRQEQARAIVLASGRFRESPALAGLLYFLLPSARRQVRAEVSAQFARMGETGLCIDHVDGHQHLHLHPVVWDELVTQCRALDAPFVRIPNEEFLPVSPRGAAGRRMEWLAFRVLRRRCLRSLSGSRIRVVERVYGHLETGRMTVDYVHDLLGRLSGPSNEIYFHPGTPHAQPLASTEQDMDVELDALLSPRIRQRIADLGLVLTNFKDLREVPVLT